MPATAEGFCIATGLSRSMAECDTALGDRWRCDKLTWVDRGLVLPYRMVIRCCICRVIDVDYGIDMDTVGMPEARQFVSTRVVP